MKEVKLYQIDKKTIKQYNDMDTIEEGDTFVIEDDKGELHFYIYTDTLKGTQDYYYIILRDD